MIFAGSGRARAYRAARRIDRANRSAGFSPSSPRLSSASPIWSSTTYTIGPGARVSWSEPGYADGFENGGQLEAIATLSAGCEHEQGQRPPALLAGGVNLGGEPSARVAQAVIGRFSYYTAGRLLLECPVALPATEQAHMPSARVRTVQAGPAMAYPCAPRYRIPSTSLRCAAAG